MPHTPIPTWMPPSAALERLIEGNRRFRDPNTPYRGRPWSGEQANEVQRPFAVLLGCSDSRTPVEILFDQGFGELFVVRIAGNIVAPSVVGSIEFAVSQFGAGLVVVMGHTKCGAIGATVRTIQTGMGPDSKNIRAITDRIYPHVDHLVHGTDTNAIVRQAVRANVRASVHHLRHGSQLIEEMIQSERVVVVAAEYELETGEVHFFDTGAIRRA